MLESEFKSRVFERLRFLFPGVQLIHNDEQFQQGIPDTLVLWYEHWAMLEFKKSRTARRQPNQPYFVDLYDRMSFAAFIYPENEEEVLRDLQEAFGTIRPAFFPFAE